MINLNDLQSKQAFDDMMDHSAKQAILLFKHSTTCPISAEAHKEFQSFLKSSDADLDAYLVKVIEDKDVSNYIAEQTGIKHESPQIFLIRDKSVLWHDSHSNITADAIKDKLQLA